MYARRMPPYYSAAAVTSNPGSQEPANAGMNNYGAPQNGANIIPGTTMPNNLPPQNQGNHQQNGGYTNQAPQNPPTQNFGNNQRNNGGNNRQPPQNPQNPPAQGNNQRNNGGPDRQPLQNPQNSQAQGNGQRNNTGNNQPPQNPQNPPAQGNYQRNNGGYDRQPPQNPQPQNQRNSQKTASNGEPDVNAQIYRIDAVDKLIDFHSNLVAAHLKDYANLHGRGGSKFAPKSTINVKICEYRKDKTGKITNSDTVNFPVCWQDFELFLERAIRAENGELYPPFGQQRAPGEPWLTFSEEKNHGYYKTNPDGTAPVLKIEINYTPIAKDGSLSSYPWFIAISNFDAPIQTLDNGTVVHKSKQAKNVRRHYINVSALEFRRAMVAVVHHIRNWESAMTIGNIRQGVKLMDQQREARKAADK